MNKYEMMFIVKATIDEAKVSEVAENLKSVITSMKGEITDSKDLGQKKLAYPINYKPEGYYVLYNFEAAAEVPAKINALMNIDENVMRSLCLKQEN